jgi:hypothetical protein
MKQSWRTIIEHPQYQVSSLGRIRHMLPDGSCREIKPRQYGNGYTGVILRGREHYIHRLVASAFIGTISPGWQINHRNFSKTDNRLQNLEIVTPYENHQHYRQPVWYQSQTKIDEFIK